MCMHMLYHFSQWLEGDFLTYLADWESAVKSSDHTALEKRKMCLSDETLQGIRMTGIYVHVHIVHGCTEDTLYMYVYTKYSPEPCALLCLCVYTCTCNMYRFTSISILLFIPAFQMQLCHLWKWQDICYRNLDSLFSVNVYHRIP